MSRHTEPLAILPGWRNLKHHPLSAIAEFGTGIDLDQLAAHMRENGYDEDEPIIILEGMIFDGRHRHAAAIAAEVTPTFRRFTGKNPLAFVMKKVLRQHLTPSQLAMLGAKLANRPEGRPEKTTEYSGVSQEQAAKILNISPDLIGQAKKVQEHGTAKLQEAVSDGTVSVSDAAKIVAEPAKVQNQAVKAVEQGKAPTAAAAVQSGNDPDLCFDCNRNRRIGKPAKRNCPNCPKNQNGTPAPTTAAPAKATLDEPLKECGKCNCCLARKAKLAASTKFVKPTLEEVAAYCAERKNKVDPQAFIDFYESKGWVVGKSAMKDWRASVRTWERNNYGAGTNGTHQSGKRKPRRGEYVEE